MKVLDSLLNDVAKQKDLDDLDLGSSSKPYPAINDHFVKACWFGRLDIIKKINELYKPKVKTKSNNAFIRLAQNIFDKFQYNRVYLDVHYYDDRCLRYAAEKGHLEVVKYLLTSDELVEKCNIHIEKDYPLRMAYENQHVDIVKFLIFDMNIYYSSHIDYYIKRYNATDLASFFETRLLYNELSQDLPIAPSTIKKRNKI